MGHTIHLVLQFDGSAFAGWQRQPDRRTVQGEVERVLATLCHHRIVAHAAGRTDAGVHAAGMSASCTVPATWTPAALRRAMNALLPPDCWVEAATLAPVGFHARKSALQRSYRYDVGITPGAASPFRRRVEWALCRPLDRPALDRAAAALLGPHDFRALAVHTGGRDNTLCDIRAARWIARGAGGDLRFEITANRFLHHMVRILVGTMVEIGLGRRPETDLPRLLAREGGVRAAAPAPAHGLFFVRADYPEISA